MHKISFGTFKKNFCTFVFSSKDLHSLSNDPGLQHWVTSSSPQFSVHAKLKHFGDSLIAADESQCAGKGIMAVQHLLGGAEEIRGKIH